MNIPQLIVTLSPSGHLSVELPGAFGSRRKIELRDNEAISTLKRILSGMEAGEAEIGLDGAPTIAQVWHWERHHTFADSRCRFCIKSANKKSKRRAKVLVDHGDVIVRQMPAKASQSNSTMSDKKAGDLGL